ncbi:MAG: TetR/AcrR family transcriptional regulator [Moraxellaceae bacterium]|nr:TetR/AcrR family transcriptional regulator [Moraxellaceae bacterium]
MNEQEPAPGHEQARRRYRGASAEERQQERRQRLIEAGITVFGEQGYHGATVRGLCAEAGLTERYFYESFANSEDLLCAVYEQVIAVQHERVLSAFITAPRNPDAMIEAGLNALFTLARERPATARIQFVEVLGVSPRVDQLYRQTVERFATLMRELYISQLPTSGGRPSDIDRDTLTVGLVGAVVGIAARWLLMGFAQPQAEVVACAAAIFRGALQQMEKPA